MKLPFLDLQAANAELEDELEAAYKRVLAEGNFILGAEVAAFEQEMRDARVDWSLVAYGGAVHSFTDWNAGNDNSKGSAYNERADKRSWEDMRDFFNELFASSGATR